MVKVIKDSILTISEDEKDIIEYYFILDQQAIDWLKNN
jgi:hypothetical protein